jgi:hypothetical protein
MNHGRFTDALKMAEEHDIIISDEEFDRYLGRNERLRQADEERKQREHEEREKKAIEMMKVVLEGKISCDIEYKKDQKYVLIRSQETGLQIASHDLERHRNIVAKV